MAVTTKPNYMPSTLNRVGTGLTSLAGGILGYSNARKEGAAAGKDAMSEAYGTGLTDVQDRRNAYETRMNDMYKKLGNRPNLVRNNSQENARAGMLRDYLGKYGGNIGAMQRYVPNQSDLQKRQLEDLRNQTFMDSTYMDPNMFNEYYGSEGQSNYGMELGLPQNGLMQSGVSGGRAVNKLMNDEFNNGITNSSQMRALIQQQLAEKANEHSKTTGMDKLGLAMAILGGIGSMAKPTMLG